MNIADFNAIESLPYLNNFVRESLRVYCPGMRHSPHTSLDRGTNRSGNGYIVNGIPRLAIHDVVIAGQLIPKGTTLYPMPSVISFNPKIWGPDAEEFNPDRWDQLSGPATDPYAWAAFGHGPRACIGKAMALLNMKTILLELVTHYDFEPVFKGKVAVVNPAGQLRPEGGVWIKLTKVTDEE
jgi:cytochrome P450